MFSRIFYRAMSPQARGYAKDFLKSMRAGAGATPQASELPSNTPLSGWWSFILNKVAIWFWVCLIALLDTRPGFFLLRLYVVWNTEERGLDDEAVAPSVEVDDAAGAFVQTHSLQALLLYLQRNSDRILRNVLAVLITVASVVVVWILLRDIEVRGRRAFLVWLFGTTSDGELIMLQADSDRSLLWSPDEHVWVSENAALAVSARAMAHTDTTTYVPMYENNGEHVSVDEAVQFLREALPKTGAACVNAPQIGVLLNVTLISAPVEASLYNAALGCPEVLLNARPALPWAGWAPTAALYAYDTGRMQEPWAGRLEKMSGAPLAVEYEHESVLWHETAYAAQCVVTDAATARCLRLLWGAEPAGAAQE